VRLLFNAIPPSSKRLSNYHLLSVDDIFEHVSDYHVPFVKQGDWEMFLTLSYQLLFYKEAIPHFIFVRKIFNLASRMGFSNYRWRHARAALTNAIFQLRYPGYFQ
jgi:hypothetical protein